MRAKRVLRIIALVMFLAAIVFVYIAVNVPTLGSVFYIGSLRVDVQVKWLFYKGYLAVMILLWVLSFLPGNTPASCRCCLQPVHDIGNICSHCSAIITLFQRGTLHRLMLSYNSSFLFFLFFSFSLFLSFYRLSAFGWAVFPS